MFFTPDSESHSRLVGRPAVLLQQLPPGTRVVVSLTQPRDLIDVYQACWERELVIVPVDPRLSPRLLRYIGQHSEPRLIISDYAVRDCGEGSMQLSPPGDAFIVYTSGTTSLPKGVVLTRAAAEHNARTMFQFHDLGPGRPHLTAMSLFHVNALMMSFLGGLLTGGDVTFLRSFEPSSFLDQIASSGANVVNVTPSMLAQLVASPRRDWWTPKFRYFLSASAPLPRSLVADFTSIYKLERIHQGYGLSESTNFSFSTHPSHYENRESWAEDFCERVPPVGVTIPGTVYRILDGEVQLHGPSLMRCYWRDPDATEQAFTDGGWLRTGDAGELRDGKLVLTGRRKEIIIRGGENASPAALEEEYREAGVVGNFAVVGVHDEYLGESFGCYGVLPDVSRIEPRVRPVAAVESEPITTIVGKPRRSEMGRRLAVISKPESSYEALRSAVMPLVQRLVSLEPSTPQQRYLYDRAHALRGLPIPGGSVPPHIRHLVDHIIQGLDGWYDGYTTGAQLIGSSGVWEELMVESPMGDYARLADQVLHAQLMGNDGKYFLGRVVELGCGVGNLSRLLDRWCADLVRTDLNEKFLNGKWGVHEHVLDFDQSLPLLYAQVFVAANALHCAKDRRVTLARLYDRLPHGGLLLLAEGEPRPVSDQPWALDVVFGFLDGWWDRGGFVPRATWLTDLSAVGFVERGYSEMRAGRYDLGGVVWARKSL